MVMIEDISGLCDNHLLEYLIKFNPGVNQVQTSASCQAGYHSHPGMTCHDFKTSHEAETKRKMGGEIAYRRLHRFAKQTDGEQIRTANRARQYPDVGYGNTTKRGYAKRVLGGRAVGSAGVGGTGSGGGGGGGSEFHCAKTRGGTQQHKHPGRKDCHAVNIYHRKESTVNAGQHPYSWEDVKDAWSKKQGKNVDKVGQLEEDVSGSSGTTTPEVIQETQNEKNTTVTSAPAIRSRRTPTKTARIPARKTKRTEAFGTTQRRASAEPEPKLDKEKVVASEGEASDVKRRQQDSWLGDVMSVVKAKQALDNGAESAEYTITRWAKGEPNVITKEVTRKTLTRGKNKGKTQDNFTSLAQNQLAKYENYLKYKDFFNHPLSMTDKQDVMTSYTALDNTNNARLDTDDMMNMTKRQITAFCKKHMGKRKIKKGSFEVNPKFVAASPEERQLWRSYIYKFNAGVGAESLVTNYSKKHLPLAEVEKYDRLKSLGSNIDSLKKAMNSAFTARNIDKLLQNYYDINYQEASDSYDSSQDKNKPLRVKVSELSPARLKTARNTAMQNKLILNLSMQSGLRIGSRKAALAGSSYGISSLQKRHMNLMGNNTVKLDFKGKDSVRNVKEIELSPTVYKALSKAYKRRGLKQNDFIFDSTDENKARDFFKSFDTNWKKEKRGSYKIHDLRTLSINNHLVRVLREADKVEPEDRPLFVQNLVGEIAMEHEHGYKMSLSSYCIRPIIQSYIDGTFSGKEWSSFGKMIEKAMIYKQRGEEIKYTKTDEEHEFLFDLLDRIRLD